ncbi:hypothetical protein K438DRAFT_1976502 [Mycena galopus ATCC 62051]|nr:hypothetical protein K438DRAFT_1976502 [Mycena galopus ATCC 62051]
MSSSHAATEREPLLQSAGNSTTRNDKNALAKFLPVVILASRGMSMFARYDYQNRWSPHSTSRRFDTWLQIPGVVLRVDMLEMAVSTLVSFISVGWWSAMGDRRGRKFVLLICVLGDLLRDVIYLAVAQSEFQESGVWVALVIEALLGGFATFSGVAHAYVSDISADSVSRAVNFCVLQATIFVSFRLGAFLPIRRIAMQLLLPPPSLRAKTWHIFMSSSPNPGYLCPHVRRVHGRRSQLVCLALSIYMYSLASAFMPKIEVFLSDPNLTLFSVPKELLLKIPTIVNILAWLCIMPSKTAASFFRHIHGDGSESGFLFAKRVAQRSLLLAALCVFALVFFWGRWLWLFAGFLAPTVMLLVLILYPLGTAGALPALYSLAATYLTSLGRGDELGAAFGSLAAWVSLGEYLSDPSTRRRPFSTGTALKNAAKEPMERDGMPVAGLRRTGATGTACWQP